MQDGSDRPARADRRKPYGFRELVGDPSARGLPGSRRLAHSDAETIQKLLEQGLDVNAQGKAGLTAFQAARLRGDTELIRLLASRGVATNAPMPLPDKLVDALFTH